MLDVCTLVALRRRAAMASSLLGLGLTLSACGGAAADAGMSLDGDVPTDLGAATDAGGTDAGSMSTDAGPVAGADSDGDGLPDAWEQDAGNPGILDWMSPDTDGDGVSDADEDSDGDGLTNLEELAFTRLTPALTTRSHPDPLEISLIVELDWMAGSNPTAAQLNRARVAFANAYVTSAAGVDGVGLHFYRDEAGISAFDFDGSFGQRFTFLSSHGPTYGDTMNPPIRYDRMVHVAVVTLRTDDALRGGEVVTDGADVIANTGVLIYRDALEALFPQCGAPGAMPPVADITLADAISATLIHEIGHTLQLGHDNSAGGGVNYFNIMSVPTSCGEAHMRFSGLGNSDPLRGATEAVGAPRFSDAASALMEFGNILSVDTAVLVDGGDGVEM